MRNEIMNNNNTYKSRMVGGMAVIAMPKGTLGKEYRRTEGKDGVIYLRPVKEEDVDKKDIVKTEVEEHGDN
jgi:hypothetical protein